jgi:hypothetical protein
MNLSALMLALAIATASQLDSQPIVGDSLAAAHIFVATPTIARQWFAAADAVPERRTPAVSGEDLAGVDRADIVALEVVLAGLTPVRAEQSLRPFRDGDHGYLARLPAAAVAVFSRASVDKDLVARVDPIAAGLRGSPKDPDWVQLSEDDLRKIVDVSRRAKGRPVFVYFSE